MPWLAGKHWDVIFGSVCQASDPRRHILHRELERTYQFRPRLAEPANLGRHHIVEHAGASAVTGQTVPNIGFVCRDRGGCGRFVRSKVAEAWFPP